MRPALKTITLAFLLVLSFLGFGQEQLDFRLTNVRRTSTSPDSLAVTIQIRSDVGGSCLRSTQLYLNYNENAFGTNVVANTNVRIQLANLVDTALIFGSSAGKLYNVASTDNTTSKLSFTVTTRQLSDNCGADLFVNGSGAKAHATVPTTWTDFVTIYWAISNPAELPLITWDENLSTGQQFFQTTSASPQQASQPDTLINNSNSLAYPLEAYDIIWDGGTWTGGTGTGGAPSSSDNTLDMLVELDTTAPMPANATVNKLILLNDCVLDLGGNTLTITGELIGSVDGRAINGTIELAGSAAQTVIGATSWENLTINNANGVTLDQGTQTITSVLRPTNGTLTTNGNLVMAASSATTYGQIAPGSGTVSGDVTMQMVIDSAGWHNLASPIASMTLDDLEDDIIINYSGNSSGVSAYYWSSTTGAFVASTDSSDNFSGGWNIYIDNNFVPSGGGLNADGKLPVVLDLTGTINTGAQTSSLGYYVASGAWSEFTGDPNGWNLIANPFPCNIDWEVVDTDFNGSGDYSDTYYIWRGDLNAGEGGYISYNIMANANGGTNTIAPFQAIWVKMNNSNGPLTTAFDFIDGDRTVESPSRLWKNQERLGLSIVRDSDIRYRDEVLFVRESGYSLLQDPRGDIVKFYNPSPGVMSFYNITPDSALLAANVIDRNFHGDTAFLGVKSEVLGNYTIAIAENSFPADFNIELYDRKTGSTTDLLNNSYTFAHDTAFDEHRFDLIAVANDISVEEPGEGGQQAFRMVVDNNGVINIEFMSGLSPEVDIEVIDLSGRVIYSQSDISTYGPLQFQFRRPLNNVSYYILRVIDEDNDNAFSEKFLY